MFNWLLPSAPAKEMVPQDKQKHAYHVYRVRLMIAAIICYSSYYVIRSNFTVSSQYLTKYRGFSASDIGLVLSALAISYGLAKFFMGVLADRLNPRTFAGVGLIISACFNIFFGQTTNKWVMVALMIGVGITQGIGAPCCQKMLAAWFDEEHLGLATSTWNISHNVGPGTVSLIVAATVAVLGAQNLSAIFLIPSLISIVMAIIVLCLGVEDPSVHGLPAVNQSKEKNVKHKTGWGAFKANILHNKLVWIICIMNCFAYIIRYGIENWIPVYLSQARGYSSFYTNLGFSIYEYAAIPGTILLGYFSDKYLKGRRLPVMIWTSIGLFILVPIYALVKPIAIVYIVLAILGICIFGQQVLMGIIIMDTLPVESVATGIGLAGFFGYAFGEVMAASGIGYIVDKTNWYSSFVIVEIAAVICIACFIYLNKKYHGTV